MKNSYLKEKWYNVDFNKISTMETYGNYSKDFKVKTVDAVNYKGKSVRFLHKKTVLENIDFLQYVVNSKLYGFQQYGYNKSELHQIREDCYNRAYIDIMEYKGEFIPIIKTVTNSIKTEVRFYYGRREVTTTQATNVSVIATGLEVYSNIDGIVDDGLKKILSDYNLRNFILESEQTLSERQLKAVNYAAGLTNNVEYLTGTDKDIIKDIAYKYFKD